MKTHIIRNTRVGISNICSVFAQKSTTWALQMAQDDEKDRLEVVKNGIKAEKETLDWLQSKGLSLDDVKAYLDKLADAYNICLK